MIEEHIRQIGLAPTKAKNISSMSKVSVQMFPYMTLEAASAGAFRQGSFHWHRICIMLQALAERHGGEVPDNFEV